MVYKTVPERSEEQTEIVNIGWLYFQIVRLNPACTFTSCLRKHKTNTNNKVLIFWGEVCANFLFFFIIEFRQRQNRMMYIEHLSQKAHLLEGTLSEELVFCIERVVFVF